MFYTIYKITNRVNNKIYIGKHQTENLDDGYMGSGTILIRAVEKYGVDKFDKEILYVFDNQLKMDNMEKEIVNEEFLLREDVYNLKVGGQGGFDYINSKCRGNSHNECKSGNYNFQLIRPTMTDKTVEKISVSMKEYYKNNYSGFKDRKHTKESKEKIGNANSKLQKGENNSQYGTCWITNHKLRLNKKIKKIDIEKWLNDGWGYGRNTSY